MAKVKVTKKKQGGIACKPLIMRREKPSYPRWAHATHREWLRDVRKRWNKLKTFLNSRENPLIGCAFYPDEVELLLTQFRDGVRKSDSIMKKYYHGA